MERWLGVIWDGGAGKSERREMPEVLVMKLERAASDEGGTPRDEPCEMMRRERLSEGVTGVIGDAREAEDVDDGEDGVDGVDGVEGGESVDAREVAVGE